MTDTPMDTSKHDLADLFAQLGLPNEPAQITAFLVEHTPMPGGLRLPDAAFWSPTQAAFLRESLVQDSDWAGPVDQLAKALQPPLHRV